MEPLDDNKKYIDIVHKDYLGLLMSVAKWG